MNPETIIQNKIIKYIKKLADDGYPIMYFRRQAGGYSYKAGLPDLFFIFDGRHVEVEVKAPGGERSPLQYKWEEKFKRINVDYLCVDNLEDFKEFMKNYIGGYNL